MSIAVDAGVQLWKSPAGDYFTGTGFDNFFYTYLDVIPEILTQGIGKFTCMDSRQRLNLKKLNLNLR
jgi:hypothetical protein